MSDPTLYVAAREALEKAGYDVTDPKCRGLVALVNFGFRSPGIDPEMLPNRKVYSCLTSKMGRHLKKIRHLVIEAGLAGVTDEHVSSVPLPAKRGKWPPHGSMNFYPEYGWRYIPPNKTYLGIRATYRLAVISGLLSAIWQADSSARVKKKCGPRKRVPILQK